MADNINKEHVENPTNNQSENSPEEIISTNDTETINSIFPTALMSGRYQQFLSPFNHKSTMQETGYNQTIMRIDF